jgi:uncharacterized iron-regulated membrane protein
MLRSDAAAAPSTWPDYRTVWRWHFYAGLFCIPFVIVLAISGSIYLFKEEIEDLLERPYNNLAVQAPAAPASRQAAAALASFPGARLQSLDLLSSGSDSSAPPTRCCWIPT